MLLQISAISYLIKHIDYNIRLLLILGLTLAVALTVFGVAVVLAHSLAFLSVFLCDIPRMPHYVAKQFALPHSLAPDNCIAKLC